MKAAVYERYGPPEVLQFKDVETPVPVGFGLLTRLVFGVSRPRQPILGSELAGVIEAVGKLVTRFNVGDEVFAFSDTKMGCHAQFKCMPQDGAVVLKPPSLTFDEAAALSFGGTTALDFLRRAKLQRGESVLVNGASGCVGTAAVQLARHFGAEVTGVCSSANEALVRSLGARHVIDYTKEDFMQNGDTYDVIVDTVGTAPFSPCKASLKEGGRLLMVVAGLPDMLQAPWVSMSGTRKLIAGPVSVRVEDLHFLAHLAEAHPLRRHRSQEGECHHHSDF